MEESKAEALGYDYTASVAQKKGLVQGVAATAIVGGLAWLILGSPVMAVIAGVVVGFLVWRANQG